MSTIRKSSLIQGGFTNGEAEQIAGKFTLKKLSKGDYFVEEGKTNKYLGFIETGFFQYYVNLDGKEKTTYSIQASFTKIKNSFTGVLLSIKVFDLKTI